MDFLLDSSIQMCYLYRPFRCKMVRYSFFKYSFLCFIAIFCLTLHGVSGEAVNCTEFINVYQERIIGIALPTEPITGVTLKICQTDVKSCCTQDLEEKLRELSKADYEKALKKTLTSLSKLFKTKSTKYNDFFKELLTKSKKDFHEMFKRTYGIVYEQNSYVFSNFFMELENYYNHGKSNLADVMDNFFTILYQKMFTVINSQYKFDEKFLMCVSEHMSDLKPFGDVPQKLSLPLKRSFVAARAYAQSLNIAGDVVANIINLLPTESCMNAVTRMLHCPVCKGIVNIKGCNNYCLNIMKGCLAYHTEMDTEWNNFIDAMSKVEQRLIGPFNIELVVEPMNVKISEAIMNFQENAAQVSAKVFSGCGKPPLAEPGRQKREVTNNGFSELVEFDEDEEDNDENDDEDEAPPPPPLSEKRKIIKNRNNVGKDNNGSGKNNRKKQKGSDLDQFITSPVYGFLKFIRDTGSQITTTRNFWKRLPYHVCSDDISVESNKNDSCWNGNSIANYELSIVSDGMKNQHLNPEVPVDIKKQSSLLNEQIFGLRTITGQLRNSFNGMDVEWVDTEETFDTGSGDRDVGSGYPPDSDDEDSDYGGSGDHSIPSGPPIIFEDNSNNNNNFNPILFTTVTTTSTTSGTVTTSMNTVSDITEKNISVNNNSTGINNNYNYNHSNSTDTSDINNTLYTNLVHYTNIKSISSTIPTNIDNTDKNNDFDNDLRNTINQNNHRNNTISGSSRYYSQVSLNRAIASYLLPAVVMWIGGSFNEWFNSLV